MSDPINHHYVPIFYLKQWGDAATGKIVRYYRPYKEVVAKEIAPDNTGFEPHLYSLDGYPPEQRQWIEKYYMGPAVDDPASKALQILLASEFTAMTGEMRANWTRFLMSLNIRDPESVAKLNTDMREAIAVRLAQNQDRYESYKASGDEATFKEWVENKVPALLMSGGTLHLPDFIDNVDIGNIVIKMHWYTFDFRSSGRDLLTSDRPYLRDRGLKDPKCIVLLPLSPRFLFVGVHAVETYHELCRSNPDKLATQINARIVAQAKKYVYGANKNHLRFVENRLIPLCS